MANDAPQEVIDEILDYFVYDHLFPPSQIRHADTASEYQSNIQVLRACSTVSKAFSHRAQAHLYAVVRLWPISRKNERDEKNKDRIEAIFDLCTAKPHIAKNIYVLDILLDGIDDYSSLVRPEDVTMVGKLNYLCGNVTTLHIRGQHQTISLRALLPILTLERITGLHLYHVKLAFSTTADFVNLSDLSLSSVNLASEDNSTTSQARIYLRNLFLQNVEDDVLDILIHNDYGRNPACYPIMDLSYLRSFRQGESIGRDCRGYLYTIQHMLKESRSSLQVLELSKHPYFAGWMNKEEGLPVPRATHSGYGLSHMEQLCDVTLVSNLCNIDPIYGLHGERIPPSVGIDTWLKFLAESKVLENLTIKFSFVSREYDPSVLFSNCDTTIHWKNLCSLVNRVSSGRSISFRLHIEWVHPQWQGSDKQDIGNAAGILRKYFDPPLFSLFDELLSPGWITPSTLFTSTGLSG